MAPETLSHSSPENKEIKVGDVIDGVVFVELSAKFGKKVYTSTDSGRKIIKIKEGSMCPIPGEPYSVRILEDTNPSNPSKGKYTVEIVQKAIYRPELAHNIPLPIKPKEREAPRKPFPVEIDEEKSVVYVLGVRIPLKETGPLTPSKENFTDFTLDQRTLEVLETVALAAELKQPCLLEGATATSKTSSIEYLAMMSGNQVSRVNLNGQTDTSELIGKYVPNDGRLQVEFEELLHNPALLSEQSRTILMHANAEKRGPTLLECQKIAALEGITAAGWQWQEGRISEAMRKGYWLILDEINLAEPQILERLNSVLERNPSLTISEHEGESIGRSKSTPVHNDFRIFATMNPAEYTGRVPMSPAYKDRWTTQIIVPSPSKEDYAAMLKMMVYGEQPAVTIKGVEYGAKKVASMFPEFEATQNFRLFLVKLAEFHKKLQDLAIANHIGRGRKESYIYTRRKLLAFFECLRNHREIDRRENKNTEITFLDNPKEAILFAIQRYYLHNVAEEDRQKVKDQLDIVGLSREQWDPKLDLKLNLKTVS